MAKKNKNLISTELPENLKEAIILENLENIQNTTLQNVNENISTENLLKNILKEFNLPVNDEILEMLKAFVGENIPLTKENLQKGKQQMQLFNIISRDENSNHQHQNQQNNIEMQKDNTNIGEKASNIPNTSNNNPNSNIEKTAFVLKNNLIINKATSNIVNNFEISNLNFNSMFEKLANAILKIDNPHIQNFILDNFTKDIQNNQNNLGEQNSLLKNEQNVVENKNMTVKVTNFENIQNLNIPENLEIPNNFNINKEEINTNDLKKNIIPLENNIEKPVLEIQEFVKDNEKIDKSIINDGKNIENIKNTIDNLQLDKSISTAPILSEKEIFDKIIQKYNINFDGEAAVIDDILQNINSNISEILEKIPNTYTDTKEILTQISRTIDFSTNLQDIIYIPIPIIIKNQKTESELYVFKDKKTKKTGKNSSALLLLNTANIGKIETYVQKIDDKINIQFKTENKKIENLIKQNIEMLTNKTNINSITYGVLDEIFNPIKQSTLGKKINDFSKIDIIT
ncbi:MAG: hypothetical protein FWF57_09700 [Defluviitaleaceae bacterium]|nr:hypothetical protein [Defluviitaleaceae bacterium]